MGKCRQKAIYTICFIIIVCFYYSYYYYFQARRSFLLFNVEGVAKYRLPSFFWFVSYFFCLPRDSVVFLHQKKKKEISVYVEVVQRPLSLFDNRW